MKKKVVLVKIVIFKKNKILDRKLILYSDNKISMTLST